MPPEGVVPNSYRQKMVVLTAYDGKRAVVVVPRTSTCFVYHHSNHEWVGLNTRFDYWVVRDELVRREGLFQHHIWDIVPEENRLRDVMIMDFLIRLATISRPEVLRMRGTQGLG